MMDISIGMSPLKKLLKKLLRHQFLCHITCLSIKLSNELFISLTQRYESCFTFCRFVAFLRNNGLDLPKIKTTRGKKKSAVGSRNPNTRNFLLELLLSLPSADEHCCEFIIKTTYVVQMEFMREMCKFNNVRHELFL